jgi:WD40 repeat protein
LFWRVAPKRRAQSEPIGEIREPKGVSSVAWSPGGESVLEGRSDGLVRLWRLRFNASRGTITAAEERAFEGHSEGAQAVLFTRDGKKGISASFDKTVRLFDLKTGEKLHQFEHDDWVFCAALVGDKQLITGSKDHTLRLWDLETGARVCNIDAGAEVRGCAISPDGKLVATGCNDKAIRLFELPSGAPAGGFTGHIDAVIGVAFSPSGKYLLSGGCDGIVILWSTTGGLRSISTFNHGEFIQSLCYGKDDGVAYFGGGVRQAPENANDPFQIGSDFDIHVLKLPVGGPQAEPARESGDPEQP